MNTSRILPALLIGSTLLGGVAVGATAHPAAAGGGIPPVINCLQNICTLLQDDARDSDGDGYTDADEKAFGSDPSDPRSTPPIRWIFASIADETLPSVWLEPQIDLLTISPDGHAITVDIKEAMAGLGLALPKRAGDFDPSAMAPAGIDLGTIGNTLDWQVHGEATSSNPRPPDAPDASLYGFTGAPPASAKIDMGNGYVYVQNSFSFGEFVSHVQVTDTDGNRKGDGVGTGSDPWEAQAAAGKDATKKATEEAAARIAAAVEAETRKQAAEADKRAAEQAAKEKAEREAREKKEKEDAEKAKHDKEKKDHGLYDPEAGSPVDPRLLTPAQFAAAIAAGNGSYFTHVGDTGVLALVTLSDYEDPTIFIIHLNPDADPSVANDTPDIGGQAGPDYDPNLPQPGTPTGGTLPPGGTNS